jgi:hypothetical protein
MMTVIPNLRWAPRLARLYSEDIRKLEAVHANHLSPGAKTWQQAVDQLARRMTQAGPAKGAKLIKRAIDYLTGIDPDQYCHFIISASCGSRNALLMFATFSTGNHPNPAVVEQGLTIELHILSCSRSHPARAIGIPVSYISKHAMARLYERGHDIVENIHATSIFAFIGVLGYLIHRSAKHADGGMHMAFNDLLAVGSLHRFTKIRANGRPIERCFFDVRTVLPTDEIGPSRQSLLDQGNAAAAAVIAWFKDTDCDESALAERIPRLERREDIYPLRRQAASAVPADQFETEE